MKPDGSLTSGGAAAVSIGAIVASGLIAVALPGVQNSLRRFVWYRRLDKPEATPPDPVFGIVWPIVQGAMAYAGWRLLRAPASRKRTTALAVLLGNVLMIPLYNAAFFTARSLTGGLAVAWALTAGAWGFLAAAWPVDRRAAVAGAPLALWSTFASYLMAEVWVRNARSARRLGL